MSKYIIGDRSTKILSENKNMVSNSLHETPAKAIRVREQHEHIENENETYLQKLKFDSNKCF